MDGLESAPNAFIGMLDGHNFGKLVIHVNEDKVTGFSNTEEEAVELTKIVPFLLEDMLKANQGLYCKGDDWASYVEVDGNLVTGQNPASSEAVAKEILRLLEK